MVSLSRLLFTLAVLFLLLASLFAGPTAHASGPFYWRTWGGKADDAGKAVAVDSSGNIYITGYTLSFGGPPRNLIVLKFSQTGSLVWQKIWTAPGSAGHGLALDSTGNIYLTGSGALRLKLNASGAIIFQRVWGNATVGAQNETVGNALALTPSGEIYITGAIRYLNNTPLILLKVNSTSGRMIWQETWGSNYAGGSTGNGVAVDASGNVYLTGSTTSFDIQYPNGTNNIATCGLDGPCHDALLLKFNSTGSLQWQRIWRMNEFSAGNTGSAVAVDTFGNVYVAGATAVAGGRGCIDCTSGLVAISKFATNGTLLWERTWRDSELGSDAGLGITLDSSGNLYATGNADTNLFLLKLSPAGNLLSVASWGGYALGQSIALDFAGNPVIAGAEVGLPSSFQTRSVSMTLNAKSPTIVVPGGVLRRQPDLSGNITGMMSDVTGSTSYAGGFDVLLVYGSSFPVSTLTPLHTLTLVAAIVIIAGCILPRHRRRISF